MFPVMCSVLDDHFISLMLTFLSAVLAICLLYGTIRVGSYCCCVVWFRIPVRRFVYYVCHISKWRLVFYDLSNYLDANILGVSGAIDARHSGLAASLLYFPESALTVTNTYSYHCCIVLFIITVQCFICMYVTFLELTSHHKSINQSYFFNTA